MAYFTKEFNPRLAKRPLKTNGRLADRRLTSLEKEATCVVTAMALHKASCLTSVSPTQEK